MTYFDEWLERVSAPTIRKGHIQMLYQSIYPKAFDGYTWAQRGRKNSLTTEQATDIIDALMVRVAKDDGPLVEPAQYEQGATWLTRYGKRLGLPERFWTERPLRFRFIGCTWFDSGRDGFYLPEYRAEYADGTLLDYHAQAWQSGKTFEFYITEPARTT